MRRRKRCPHCLCLFAPDPRVRDRQRACSKAECQRKQRAKTQASYRARNPDDAEARRLRKALAAAKASGRAPRPRGTLPSIPWDEMKDEIPAQALVIAGVLVRLVLGKAKDQRRAQAIVITKESGALVPAAEEDQTARRAAGG